MSKARILVVEDEIIIAMEIENSLKNLGYEITSVVNSGDEAIQNAEREKPDLILMDIRIKGDKDGIETAEIIRNKFGIPVVFSTAYLEEDRIERAKIAMPFGYVLKPIQERDLKVTLEMALYVANADVKRRNTENDLRAHKQQLEIIYNSTSNYMCLLEVEQPDCFRFVSINDAYMEGIKRIKPDLTRESITGLRIEELGKLVNWPDSITKSFVASYKNAIQTKSPVKIVDVVPLKEEDRFLQSTYTPIFDNEGSCSHILFVSNDITEFKKTEEQIQDITDRFRLLIENINDLACEVDAEGRYTYLNQQYKRILGYNPDELIGRLARELMHPNQLDESQPRFRKLVDSGETRKDLWQFRHKNGEYLWFECNAKTYKLQNGDTRVLVISKNLDESEVEQVV